MHFAVRYKNFNAIHALAKSEKNVNPANYEMVTPLHICAKFGFLDCAQIIVDNCKKYKDFFSPKDLKGHTPLQYLALYSQAQSDSLVKILGNEINDDKDIEDALKLCCELGCSKLYNEMLKLL